VNEAVGPLTAAAAAIAYLLGAVPFAALAARACGRDLRREGSGNLGATNAIRVLGPAIGVPVLLADIAKGWVAVAFLPGWLGASGVTTALLCGVAVVAGHVWPVFLRFRGGKGVAAGAGAFLGLAPAATGMALAVFVIVLLGTRYVSLASMIAGATLPVFLWLRSAPPAVWWVGLALAVLVIVRHRANIRRLASGTENRVRWRGRKREASPQGESR
jgi:glycerol-3-phosphate acyltransferase PlsY